MIGAKLNTDKSSLPEGWQVALVGDIGQYINGYPFKPTDWKKIGKPIIRIQNLNDRAKPFNYFRGDIDDRYRVRRGDILISWSASLGTYRWEGDDAWLNQHIFKAIPDETKIDSEFFYWAMVYAIERIAKNARGSTMAHVTGKEFKGSEFLLPLREEQRKIAGLLGLVQRAIEQQERLLQLTAELKKTLLHQLFTQGLRGEPQKQSNIGPVPESWEVISLEYAALAFDYGTSVKCEHDKAGFPVLRIPNVVGGSIDLSDLKHGLPKRSEQDQLRLQNGDLLFVRTNGVLENAGRCALYRGELEGCYFASYLIRVRVDCSKVLPAFLNEYARTERGRSFLSGRAIRTADGKFNINSGTLKRVLLPLPSPVEQKEIVRQLDLVNRKLKLHEAKCGTLSNLFRTLLHHLMTAQIKLLDVHIPELLGIVQRAENIVDTGITPCQKGDKQNIVA